MKKAALKKYIADNAVMSYQIIQCFAEDVVKNQYDDNGKTLFYVQLSKKIDNNISSVINPVSSKETIIGQYPNPNTDDKIYTWGKYNN